MDFISVILTEMKFQTGMKFSCEHSFPKTKWISADSLDVAFNAHVRLKLNAGMDFISVILTEMNFHFGYKISCKHYPKWNAYICPSKYRVTWKCSRNETSCEQSLFSSRLEISNRYEFISLLIWTYSYHSIIFHFRKQPAEVFYQECGVKKFSKFKGKRLSQTLLFNKFANVMSVSLLKKRLWHRYFRRNCAKYLRKPFCRKPLSDCFCIFNLWRC